jgi:hypothetical protein
MHHYKYRRGVLMEFSLTSLQHSACLAYIDTRVFSWHLSIAGIALLQRHRLPRLEFTGYELGEPALGVID